MNYVYVGLASFVAGVVLCRLYYYNVISAGKHLLGEAEDKLKKVLP